MNSSTKYILYLLLSLTLAKPALAQSLGLAPAQIKADFKPGVSFEQEFSIANNGTEAVELRAYITDFWYNDQNEQLFNVPGTSPRSAANWVQFVTERFEVPARGWKTMKMIVTPPSDARGSYYAVAFVESKPIATAGSVGGKRIFANMRIGCLVLLTAINSERYNLNLGDVKLTPSKSDGLKLSFLVDNESNTDVSPRVRLAILDSDRKLVGKADVQTKRFLPGQKDSIDVDWSGDLPAGHYTAMLLLTYGRDLVESRSIAFSVPYAAW